MAQPSWTAQGDLANSKPKSKLPYLILGVIMLSAMIGLVAMVIQQNGEYYLTISEYQAEPEKYVGRDVQVTGWVMGDSITFEQIDKYTSRIEFDIVEGYDDVSNPLHIVVMNEPLPDLLHHESQALVSGKMVDGEFHANPKGLLLKCPTRYEGAEDATQNNYEDDVLYEQILE